MLSQPSDSESEHNYLGSIQPTLNDVLLALTLPPSALALCVWMPKRRRERILEVTKTVTVTEIANAHPKLLQNHQHTVSNVEVGNGHPVTLHISQTTDQYEAASSPKAGESSEQLDFTYRNPLINCEDDEDVIETVHTVNEKFIQFPESMVVDVQSKVNRSHSGNNADNIIDISFDTSRTELSKTSGNKKAHLSAYFRPSRSLDVLLLSPTDTGFYTSPNRSGLVDGSESDGSMIIHTDDERRLDSGVSSVTGIRIRGNKAFGERANRLVPVSSDDDDLIYLPSMPTTSSTLPRSSRKRARGGRKYIVTSLTKSQSNPSIYQNTSVDGSTTQRVKNSVSQGEINRTFCSGQEESTNRSHLYIKNSCKPSHSYTVTAVTETVHQDVPTDSERDLSIHKITVDLELDRLQQSGSHLNEIIRIENVYQNEISHLPPRMSSTPLSTLEKSQKRSHQINQEVKVLTSSDGVEVYVSNSEELHPVPRIRQAVSPIIVVNQTRSRKGSTDNISNTPRENKRKSTVTDIDWFAAFNMKEPLTPRSPRSPLPIDALKECERYVLENDNFPRRIPLAHIEVDDIFKCVNDGSSTSNVCTCSACSLSKIPDIELRKMLKEKMKATRYNTYIYPDDGEVMPKPNNSSIPLSSITIDDVFRKPNQSAITNNKTIENIIVPQQLREHSAVDISLDDVFAGTSEKQSKKQSIDFDKYIQRGRELEESSTGGFNTNVSHTQTVEVHRRQSSVPDANITIEELFDETKPQSSHDPIDTSESLSLEAEASHASEVRSRTTEDSRTVQPALEISLDDVFAGTSGEQSKKQSIDFDKYIQRGRELKESSAGGFNTNVSHTQTVEVHRRQSSVPDANITIEELFDETKPQSSHDPINTSESPSLEIEASHASEVRSRSTEDSRTVQPALDISLDDVFAGTSGEQSKKHSIDFDKYIQRGRELKESSTGGFNTNVSHTQTVEVHRRQSSVPDANITIEELFDETKPQSSHDPINTSESPSLEIEASHASEVRSRSTEDSRTVQPALDISLDDVFAGTSGEQSKKQSIDFDKYIQRGRELKESSAGGFNTNVSHTQTVEVHRRQSSVPDANITIEELFDETKPQSSHDPINTSESPSLEIEASHASEVRSRSTEDSRTVQPALDISLDDVFAGTSGEQSKKQSIDFDKYIQRGRELKESSTGGFNTNVSHTQTVEVHRRQSSVPDANITIEELFDETKPQSSHDPINTSESPSLEIEASHASEVRSRSTEDSRTVQPALDISLDDVFAGTSGEQSKKQSIDFDKYIQRGRELKESSTGGFNTNVSHTQTVEVHRRQSSVPDANITIEELFDETKPQSSHDPINTSESPSLEIEASHASEVRSRSTEDSRTVQPALDISLDDVFAGTSGEQSKKQSIDFDKYIQRGRELKESSTGGFNTNVSHTQTVEVHRRQSSVPDANITIEELFDETKPQSSHDPINTSESPSLEIEASHASEVRSRSTEDSRTVQPALDISLDDVFAGTSSEQSKKQSIDFDKYIQRGRELKESSTGGFNTNVSHTQTVEVHRRQSSVPDANITIEELFDETKPQSSHDPINTSESPSLEIEASHASEVRSRSTEDSRTVQPALDISLDDVFAGTSGEQSKKQSIDFDKYIQRGRELKESSTGGFNTNVSHTQTVEVHRRQSSVPDANITIEELFDETKPQSSHDPINTSESPSLEIEASHASEVRSRSTEDSRTVQPALDISLDDVFAGTSGEQSKKQSIDFDKYIQRGRELKESSAGGFNTNVSHTQTVEVHRRQSSVPDANITIEELFDEPKPQSSHDPINTSESLSLEAEASHASEVRSRSTEDSRTVQPALDISLDDVFAGTSGEQSKKQSIDFDKYIQRGRELKESSTGGFNTNVSPTQTVEVHRRQSSVPDANITIEELFDETKPQSSHGPINTSESPSLEIEASHASEVRSRSTEDSRTVQPPLDISLDDIFAGASSELSKKQSIDFDKYIQRGRELKESSAGGFNTNVSHTQTVEVHRRQSSVPDANITIEELFDETKPQSSHDPINTSEILSLEAEASHASKVRSGTTEDSKTVQPALDISLDDVFAGTSGEQSKKQSIDFDKYIQRGRELKESSAGGFNTNVSHTQTVEVHRRQSSVPDANITIEELFDETKPQSSHDPINTSESPSLEIEASHASEVRSRSTEDSRTVQPALDISLDDVFAGTSSEQSKKQSIDFDKYIQRGCELKESSAGGFNTNVSHTQTVEVHRRQSSVPDANITIEELFDETKPQSSHDPINTSESLSLEAEASHASAVRSRTTEDSKTVQLALDISLDDVFAGTSSEQSKKQSIDFDKYIQRGRELKESSAGGFNTNVSHTQTVEVHRRQSSVPDANITIEELFDETKPQSSHDPINTSESPSFEAEASHASEVRSRSTENSRTVQPALDISLDDVFAGTSSEQSKKQSIDFDKYIQRGRELKESSTGGFNTNVSHTQTVEVHRRQSSVPDANITIEELFDETKPQSSHDPINTSEILSLEAEASHASKVRSGTTEDSKTVQPVLDISLDDVFAGTSGGQSKKQSIDFDKYIQRGRELKESSTGGFNTNVSHTQTVEVHRRQSSVPDANITIEELFDETKPQSSHDPINTSESPSLEIEASHASEVRSRSTEDSRTVQPALDISLDDVFAGTSSEQSKKQSIDFDKYIQRGRELKESSTGGFNTNVSHTQTVEVHRRQSSVPDANITIEELFDETKPQSSHDPINTSEILSLEAEASHASKVRSGTTEDSKTVQPVLDISLDDVFAGTSGGQSKKQSIDFDKYIQRGRELKESSTGGFNTTVRNVDAVDVCPRKSSLPDANITMEELFDEIKTQPVIPHVKNFHGKLDSVNSEKREKLFESDNSIDDICLNRQESLPTPPNSLCDSSEELFIDSSLPVEEKDSDAVSDDDDENTDHRTRSRSVTSMNGKKVFTVTFPGQTDDVEEAEPSILSGPRPEATRKIRKPTPNIERTSVFDIFNIISGDNAEEEKNLKESNDSDDTSSASSSFIQMERRPIIPRIHSTSLTVSLDDLGRSEHENSHIITSQAYELPEGFPTAVPSRRASRYSVRTDELDENISCHNYVRTKTRTHNSDFSDFYNDLKSPPRTPIKLKRRSIDFYYEEPMEMPVEEEVDVQDFVDEILNQSLDEAAFLATSKHMSFKKEVPRSTDTSIDRKQSEADSQIFSDMAFSSISANSEHMTDHVFVSSTNRNSLYEAILTCPETDNVPLSPTSYPREEQKMETIDMNIDLAQKTFISEASVVLKENQSEDYIVRLLFPEKPEETIIVQEDYEESDDQSKNTTNVTSNIKHIIEKMAPQQKDDEYLEVEVNSEYFIIHGKYSMIIHKTEPLGEMLSKIQTSSLDFTVTPKLRKILRQCLHNKISGNNGTDISSRAFHMLNRADPAYDNLNKMALNRFTENNRSGNINFCTAENMVCRPLLQHRIRENLNIVEEHLFHYAPGGGYDDVKETILGYLKKFMRGTHVQKRDLTLVGSGNTCYDLICHCLYESEDVILTNTPSYARLFLDCSERAGCRVEAVPMDLNKLEIDLQAFEKVLNEQREQGNTVKGIVLINPNNPLGITFPKSQVLALGDWASGNDLSLIVDESFSNSNYGDGESESFLSYQHELKNPSKAVWFWSLSKDFGLPGVKIATLHTPNPSLNEAISALELIYPVSALAQDFASNLLSDYDWAEQFHKTKNYRIGKHYEFVAANLRALNLDFITATSGFYVLVDFRQKMKSRTFEEEDKVWHLLIANGVFMTRGKDMRCAQPGWMRLVFGCDKDQVEEGIRRLHKMFGSTANVIGSINY